MPPGSVAIIGGGVSGLVCAHRLRQLGVVKVTVFDTGRHGPGGRCSSRHVMIDGRSYTFDHSAQYFTVGHPRFARVVEFLEKEKACRLWKEGIVGTLDASSGRFERHDENVYVGIDGMASVPRCLARGLDVRCGVWVNEVSLDEESRRWRLPRGEWFDYLVVAHNGKCAARLMAPTPAGDVHRALVTRFGPRVAPGPAGGRNMQLCSLWVLLVAFDASLRLPFHAGHVCGDPDLAWVANNSAKYPDSGPLECWTAISTREFGAKHKAPQENVPEAKRRQVVDLLTAAFLRCAGRFLGRGAAPAVRHASVQLWGAAVPLNVAADPSDGCLLDGPRRVGVCGDWLESPCLEGAAVSGLKLADRLVAHMKGDPTSVLKSQVQFRAFGGSEIGHFPSSKTGDCVPQK